MAWLLALALVGGGGKVEWKRGAGESPLRAALGSLAPDGRVLVYFTADWCGFCSKLDAGALSNDEVVELSRRLPRVLIDCTDRTFYRQMTAKYALEGLPTLALLDGRGRIVDSRLGFNPDVRVYLDFLHRVPAPESPSERILRRIDERLRESEERLRAGMAEVVRDALRPSRAWLGFQPGAPEETGICIESVIPEGPFDRAGVRAGDILLLVGGTAVSEDSLPRLLESFKPGDKVEVVILRGGERRTLSVTLGEKK